MPGVNIRKLPVSEIDGVIHTFLRLAGDRNYLVLFFSILKYKIMFRHHNHVYSTNSSDSSLSVTLRLPVVTTVAVDAMLACWTKDLEKTSLVVALSYCMSGLLLTVVVTSLKCQPNLYMFHVEESVMFLACLPILFVCLILRCGR